MRGFRVLARVQLSTPQHLARVDCKPRAPSALKEIWLGMISAVHYQLCRERGQEQEQVRGLEV